MADGSFIIGDDGQLLLNSSGEADICESCCDSLLPVTGIEHLYASSEEATLGIASGNPAIAFMDTSSPYDMHFARSLSSNGCGWPHDTTTIGTIGSGAQYLRYLNVDGNPAIFYDKSGTIYMVRATNSTGTSWGSPVTVATGYTYRRWSPKIVNGNPAISYFSGSGDFMFIRASNAQGSSWPVSGTTVMAYSASSPSFQGVGDACLEVVDGRPAVACVNNFNNRSLEYWRANNANGTSWPSSSTVIINAFRIWSCFVLKVVDGNPACFWRADSASKRVYISRATDAQGTSWGGYVKIHSSGGGDFPYVAIRDGKPVVSYWTGSNGAYVEATNSTGSAWGSITTIDSFIGGNLEIVDGRPARAKPLTENGFQRAGVADGSSWTGVVISLIYDGNGNTGGTAPSNHHSEGCIVTKANTGSLVKTGYTFDGWNTQADGLGTDYAEGAIYQTPTGVQTLYAKWV